MNEQQCLEKMITPSQERPGIWRKGVLQIFITRSCDKSCCGCTQGSNLTGKANSITPEQFSQALDSLKGYWGVHGIFGGNPCTNVHFKEICRIFRERVPYEQRGIWCNHPLTPDNAREMALTFNPNVSNLNLHQDQSAYDMFAQYWPGARHQLKGLTLDSEHTSWWRSPTDLGVPEEERWERISKCDVNQLWSAMIYPFRGQMRGSICEIMGAMDMLKQDQHEECWKCQGRGETQVQYNAEVSIPCWECAPINGVYGKHGPSKGRVWSWPDTGIDINQTYEGKLWWQLPIEAFREQIKSHCHHCMMPYKDRPLMANGNTEEVTEFWKDTIIPKKKDRLVQLITTSDTIQKDAKVHATDYVKQHQL